MTETTTINNSKIYDKLLRIEYQKPNYDGTYPIYVSHLDSSFKTATIKDFVYRYKNDKLIYLPAEKLNEIYDSDSVFERYGASDEGLIVINTDNIYAISMEKVPRTFTDTETFQKLMDIGKEFTKSKLYEKLNLSGFKVYPKNLKDGKSSDFIIDYLKDFKLEFSYSDGIKVENQTFYKLRKNNKRFFYKNVYGDITPYLKFFEDNNEK